MPKACDSGFRTGTAHAGLVLVWVLAFGFAAYFVENDYVIWTPLVFYAAHALFILVLVMVAIARRLRAVDRAANKALR